jgi:Lar family restriction alleviation protein
MTKPKDSTRKRDHVVVLLPCPFCGCGDVYIDEADDGFARWVSCDECETTGPVNPKGNFENSHRDVAEAWNRRRSDGLRHWLRSEGDKCDEAAKRNSGVGSITPIVARDVYRRAEKQAEKLLDVPVGK